MRYLLFGGNSSHKVFFCLLFSCTISACSLVFLLLYVFCAPPPWDRFITCSFTEPGARPFFCMFCQSCFDAFRAPLFCPYIPCLKTFGIIMAVAGINQLDSSDSRGVRRAKLSLREVCLLLPVLLSMSNDNSSTL